MKTQSVSEDAEREGVPFKAEIIPYEPGQVMLPRDTDFSFFSTLCVKTKGDEEIFF